jgi:hypothetical protein
MTADIEHIRERTCFFVSPVFLMIQKRNGMVRGGGGHIHLVLSWLLEVEGCKWAAGAEVGSVFEAWRFFETEFANGRWLFDVRYRGGRHRVVMMVMPGDIEGLKGNRKGEEGLYIGIGNE